ncbi:MAG: tetratricopeptide repeat protein [Leptolyngbyaceae cyanobacterium RU_5_1]|nr:tetratricopeptide repeat protein [Leptolyngbyaceae cyanobacterium RU_5_1]
MLVGSGIGSVVTVATTAASQQILYTVAPISALLLLNLLNHRRIEKTAQEMTETSVSQVDQKLSKLITALHQQIQTLPSALHLASLRKDLQSKNQSAFNELSQTIQQLQREIAESDWRPIQQEVRQLQERYALLADSLVGVTESLHRLSVSHKSRYLEDEIGNLKAELSQLRVSLQSIGSEQKLNHSRTLQDQIDQINRRLNKLPAPFDASALKQDVETLIKVMGEMVSRRDLSRFEAQIEKLTQHNNDLEQSIAPLRASTNILRKQVDTVTARLNAVEEAIAFPASATNLQPKVIETLTATINALEQRINQLPASSDLATLRTELQALVSNYSGQLQQQLEAVQQQAQDFNQQQRTLHEWIKQLPQLLDSSPLQTEINYLVTRMEWAENTVADLQTQMDAVRVPLDEVMQQLQTNQSVPQYELVFDVKHQGLGGREEDTETRRRGDAERSHSAISTLQSPLCNLHFGSRTILEQSLESAQARLIVVFPFPSPAILDNQMIQKFQQFLDRKGCLDIGWGYLGDMRTGKAIPGSVAEGFTNGAIVSRENSRSPRSIDRRRAINSTEQGFLYTTLNQLTKLKKQYPEQFRFKVLGTSENFLVCDRAFAILGVQSMATASVVFPEAAVGLRTTDPTVIQGLVDRFDNPVLTTDDAVAYFNRASTRYDLSDYSGAIADYTEALTINPTDDVAYNDRGLARYDSGDQEGAIADLEAAIQHNPDNFIAYCNRGFIRSELGDKLGAIADYTDAIQINPDHTSAYFYRGLARTRMQNRLGAIQDYTEVIQRNPKDASAYFYRGLGCAKLGHQMQAIRDLRQAAQLFAEQGDSLNYRQTISTIKKLHKTFIVSDPEEPLVSNDV